MITDIGNFAFQAGYVFSGYFSPFGTYKFLAVNGIMYLYLNQVERFLVHE